MKILVIGPLPNPIDGCSLSNSTLCKNLQKQKISFKTINTNVKSVSSNQGTSFSLKKAFIFFKVYFKVFSVFSSDVVYLTPGQTFFGVLKYSPFIVLSQWLRKPYVIHVHGNYMGKEYQLLEGIKKRIFYKLVSKASAGIVLSISLKDNFKDLLPIDKVVVVENFANDELYLNFDKKVKEKEIPSILFLSNLIAEKGIIDLLDALIILKAKNIKFKTFLAGKIEQEFSEIIDQKMRSIGEQVEYLGVIKGDQKQNILNKANIFVLPTYYKMEGQPISILEAMATGNIIITTKHAGIPDVFSEKNGYFVDPQSPEQIADCIATISLDVNKEVEKYMEINTLYAKERFTETIFSNAIIEVLKKVSKN